MRRTILLLAATAVLSVSAQNIRKESDGTTVVNTAALGEKVKGFQGTTPLDIYIKSNKIVKIVALGNKETPRYFQRVKTLLLPKYVGMSVSKAKKAKVDGVTGATYSSDAVKKNVQLGIAHYLKHR